MVQKTEEFNKVQLKKGLPEIRPGDTVKVYQKIKEKNKERIQIFEGTVIARKHGKGISSTITVRRVSSGIGVERIFPLHSPNIEKIEIVKRGKVKRAKLYYLRKAKGKKAKLKQKELVVSDNKEDVVEENKEENKEEKKEENKEEQAEKKEENKEEHLKEEQAEKKEEEK